MSAEKLTNDIYWIGVKDSELRVFDIIMSTKKGTTYNSYLINDEKVAIIDCVKNDFMEEYHKNIKEVIGDRKVDYIVVQHTELDHSGSLKCLMDVYPEAVIVGTRAAINYTKDIVNRDFDSIIAEGELDLGKNKLKFISAPNLHWPDTMFTYIENEKILFTCDFMGCHYCPEGCITDECSGDYYIEMRYYFEVIMGPFKKFVNMGLDKIKDLDFNIVAPSHGPVHVSDVNHYLELYKEWAKIEAPVEKNIQILYISAYGNTEAVARHFEEKLLEKGIKAEAIDITSTDMEVLTYKVSRATALLVGSPTINQDAVKPAWDLLETVSPITNRGKLAAAFGSYGWSGEAVPMLMERLKSLKLKTPESGFRFKFVPDEKKFEEADKFLENFIEMM